MYMLPDLQFFMASLAELKIFTRFKFLLYFKQFLNENFFKEIHWIEKGQTFFKKKMKHVDNNTR